MTSLAEQQEIIQKFKEIDASISNDATWNDPVNTLLNKLTTIDNYLKQRVGTQARYTGLAKEKIQEIKAEFANLKAEFKDLKKRMLGCEKTIAENEADKDELNELVKKLREEAAADAEELDRLNSNSQAFGEQGEILRQRKEEIEMELTEERNAKKTLKEELAAKDKEIIDLKGQIAAKEGEIASLNERIEELTANIETLKSDMTDKEQIQALDTQVVKLTKEKSDLETELAAEKAKSNGLREEIELLNTKISDLERELAAVKAEKDAALARADAADAQVADLTRRLDEATAALAEKNNESAELTEKINSIRTELLKIHNDEYQTLVEQLDELLEKAKTITEDDEGDDQGGPPSRRDSMVSDLSVSQPPSRRGSAEGRDAGSVAPSQLAHGSVLFQPPATLRTQASEDQPVILPVVPSPAALKRGVGLGVSGRVGSPRTPPPLPSVAASEEEGKEAAVDLSNKKIGYAQAPSNIGNTSNPIQENLKKLNPKPRDIEIDKEFWARVPKPNGMGFDYKKGKVSNIMNSGVFTMTYEDGSNSGDLVPGKVYTSKPALGGKLSKKYRKINLKSKKHYKRANKVTKKRRKMMGGYIAKYSTSSRENKTKKVKSSSKSSSSNK